jgi:hypothetical protein
MLRPLFVLIFFLLTSCTSSTDQQGSDIPQQQTVDNQIQHPDAPEPVLSDTDGASATPSPDRIRDAQQRLRDRNQPENPAPSDDQLRYRLDFAPYNQFNDIDGYFDITGATLQEIQSVLGEPVALVRQGREGAPVRREVRVYYPYQEDSTGLYLYIVNGIVEEFRLDTFMGLANSDVLDFFR